MSARRLGLPHIADVAQTWRPLASMTKVALHAPGLAITGAHDMEMFSNAGSRLWPNVHAIERAGPTD